MAAQIIVIENNEAIREFLTLSLMDEGWDVVSYAYSQINLAALKQGQPDLIILDFNVRDSSEGWEMLQLLKMEDTTAKIPILIVTTAFQLSMEVKAYLSAHHIVVTNKPFELEEFVLLIQQTLTLAGQSGSIFSSTQPLPILETVRKAE